MQAESAEAVEEIDCLSEEEYDSPSERPKHDTNPSDGEAPVLELWGM